MRWKAKLPFFWLAVTLVSLLLFLGVFYPERAFDLHNSWTNNEEFSLGYPLLALSIYFSMKNLDTHNINSNLLFIPLSIFISCAFLITDNLDLNGPFFVILSLAFPIMVATTIGINSALSIIIPWGIVWMAMPFWTILTPFLQTITVKAVSILASTSSLTVLVEGNYFTIASGVVHVEGGCSGLKYFMSSITLALVSSSLGKRRLSISLASIVIAAMLAVLGNWIRVFILLLVAYFKGIEHPLMSDHDALGWIIFALVLAPWLYIDTHLDKAGRNKNTPLPNSSPTQLPNRQILFALGTFLTLITIPQLLIQSPRFEQNQSIVLPTETHSNIQKITKTSTWKPSYPATPNSSSASYIIEGEVLDVTVLSYAISGDTEMATSTNSPFNKDIWQLVSDNSWQSNTDKRIKIRIAQAKSNKEHRVVYYWYRHGEQFANTIYSSKLAQLLSVYDNVFSSQLFAISKKCNLQCQQSSTPSKTIIKLITKLHDKTVPAETVKNKD